MPKSRSKVNRKKHDVKIHVKRSKPKMNRHIYENPLDWRMSADIVNLTEIIGPCYDGAPILQTDKQTVKRSNKLNKRDIQAIENLLAPTIAQN